MDDTFIGCSELASITVPNNVLSLKGSFENCSSLKDVILPSGLTIIDASTFKECSKISSITIPESVRTIGEKAFQNCTSLTSIDLEMTISIGDYAFDGCSNLSSLQLPYNSIGDITIGKYAFYNCTSLTSIEIDNNMKSIGAYAFDGCPLTKIYNHIPTHLNCNMPYSAISNRANCDLYVPSGASEQYSKLGAWSGFKSYVEM